MNDQRSNITSNETLTVYGSDVSYYTGKLEAYLRAKGIPYVLEPFSESNMRHCEAHTGLVQIPQVRCPDGRWLVDTTLMIEYFEQQDLEPRISPRDPAIRFISRLLEDYADEWLWRPAMHYRWSFPATAQLMSDWLSEHLAERRVPQWMKRRWWKHRQFGTFVKGDGVTAQTRAAVEKTYLDTLYALESIFTKRPFILGQRPTEADYGFFSSMFRHFSCDPAPARIMRDRAPGVYEWVARMWNLTPDKLAAYPEVEELPSDMNQLYEVISQIYLPYLEANAQAYADHQKQLRHQLQGVDFVEPVKPYRVWCRDCLQQSLSELNSAARTSIEQALGKETIARLSKASPKPAHQPVDQLPISTPPAHKGVDSWWRNTR